MHMQELLKRAKDNPDSLAQRFGEMRAQALALNLGYNAFIEIFGEEECCPDIIRAYRDRPLFGLICAVKDCIAIEGRECSLGLRPAVIARASKDASIINQLRELGVVLIGRTNLDELCLSYLANNRFYGRVPCPLDTLRTVAGSSCGSAAAVALGVADFALGTDMGGSVRLPAAACGISCAVMGAGMLPMEGIVSLSPRFDRLGILARSQTELHFLTQHLAPQMSQRAVQRFIAPHPSELAGMAEEATQEFEAGLDKRTQHRELRRDLSGVEFENARAAHKTLVCLDVAYNLATLGVKQELLSPIAQAIIRRASSIDNTDENDAALQIEALRNRHRDVLSGEVRILAPVLPARPPLWSEIDAGVEFGPRSMLRFMALGNVLGTPILAHRNLQEIGYSG